MITAPPFRTEQVSFSYDGKQVLKDISLVVEKGDFLGLIGPNGSGKSTLLKLLLGLLKPASGIIEVFGKPIAGFKDWSRIGYVSQRATHFDISFPATVREVVTQGRVARAGVFRRLGLADSLAIGKALEAVDMADMKDRLIGALSGGQQQRVFIARALASEPEVLVLDEPTIGVDPGAHQRFFELMKSLHDEKGLTIIMVSHQVDVLMSEVTKLACLNQVLLFHGTPEQCIKDNCLVQPYGPGFHSVTHSHPWRQD